MDTAWDMWGGVWLGRRDWEEGDSAPDSRLLTEEAPREGIIPPCDDWASDACPCKRITIVKFSDHRFFFEQDVLVKVKHHTSDATKF